MSLPRLTFAIATMNRPDELAAVLAGIAPQIDASVEIVILDGSRDDRTEHMVGRWRDRLPLLHYRRQPPAGLDRDFNAAVQLGRGEYCWLLPDDDLLKPGAVAAVLGAVADQPDCVVVNAEVRDRDLQTVLQAHRLPPATPTRFAPAAFDAFARATLAYLTYVGGLVVRRDVWTARDAAPYFGSWFVHVGVLFQRPLERPMKVLTHPWIGIRFGQASWKAQALDIWHVRWPRLVWSLDALSAETRAAVVAREPWRNLRTLVKDRATGALDWQSYRRVLHALPLGLPRRAFSLLLCALPRPWLRRTVRNYLRRHPVSDPLLRWELEND